MRIESLTVALRPRPMMEAADLGVALVRTHARSVWRTFTPALGLILALACASAQIKPWLPGLVIFWFKPWLDCSLLFVLSRAVFGQPTRFADLWQQRAAVWRGQWLRTLLWQRLSAWRAFTQPVFQLEGLHGRALRQRCKLLLDGQRFTAGAMQYAFACAEQSFYLGVMATVFWLLPAGHRLDNMLGWLNDAQGHWAWLNACLYAAIVLALEPFFVAAGLTMYLNRRVQLEAWDIEQEFRHAFGSS